MAITRRSLLGLMSGSTFVLTAAPGALGTLSAPPPLDPARFPQGVASGDPRPDSVMLWPRAEPLAPGAPAVTLLLEVSSDPDFTELVLQSPLRAPAESDYTVRAFVDGLAADSIYYYRFRGARDSRSRTGRTRTAPAADQARRINLAFTSCQSYEQAHYGAWARMIAQDEQAADGEAIDFVLHLGDFIYERCWHTRIDGTPQARRVPDFPDGVDSEKNRYAVSLADYRHLYKVYLSDPHLQAARARWPFVCTWDDHEYANDNYQSYSTYNGEHVCDPQRKLHANQAWFEFIPTVLDELQQAAHDFRATALAGPAEAQNAAAVDSLRIYRRLSWGRQLDLVLTDLRSYRSPPCLEEGFADSLGLPLDPVELVEIADAGRDYAGGHAPATLRWGDGSTPNPARDRAPGSMLGAAQRDWFLRTLGDSPARWKLWGNSLPLLPMRLDLSSLPLTVYEDSIFNLDAWAGYPHEVRLLMDGLRERQVGGVVSLSGDHHMHGAGSIRRSPAEPDAPAVTVDFTVAGISSSPIFEDLMAVARRNYNAFRTLVYREDGDGLDPVWNMSMLDGVLPAYLYSKTGLKGPARWLGPNAANPGLRYVDTTANGYGLASFDADALSVSMVTLEDCREAFSEPPAIAHVAHFRLPHWRGGEAPQLQGPEFEGSAPFPFEPSAV